MRDALSVARLGASSWDEEGPEAAEDTMPKGSPLRTAERVC